MYILKNNPKSIAAVLIVSLFSFFCLGLCTPSAEADIRWGDEEIVSSEQLGNVAKGAFTVFLLKMLYDSMAGSGSSRSRTAEPTPSPDDPEETQPTEKLDGRVIVIDPGHGGRDPGAVGPTGLTEKEVALDISLRLRDLLRENTGATVYLTRETDRYLTLSSRASIARQRNADIFISVHNNAFTSPSARGIETYTHSSAGPASRSLGWYVQRRMVEMLGLVDRGLKTANFAVLRGTLNMKSILVEIGFISNPREEALLRDPSFRQRSAEAIYLGILDYHASR